jgi:high-affinity nickel permease
MITLFSVVVLGLFLGMRHATDADHVIAVSTIVSRENKLRSATLIGGLWGIGHTITVMIVGTAILLFGVVIPRRTGLALEFSVGLMLITLGLLNLKDLRNWFRNLKDNKEGASLPQEDPTTNRLDRLFGGLRSYQMLRPLIVGCVHGLAGSAALALMVIPIIQDPRWAVAYLLVFGIGTIAGMMFITAAISVPFTWTARRSAQFNQRLGVATSFLSVGFGLFLVYQIGFVEGLFK